MGAPRLPQSPVASLRCLRALPAGGEGTEAPPLHHVAGLRRISARAVLAVAADGCRVVVSGWHRRARPARRRRLTSWNRIVRDPGRSVDHHRRTRGGRHLLSAGAEQMPVERVSARPSGPDDEHQSVPVLRGCRAVELSHCRSSADRNVRTRTARCLAQANPSASLSERPRRHRSAAQVPYRRPPRSHPDACAMIIAGSRQLRTSVMAS